MIYKLFACELSEQEKYGIKSELFQNAYASVKINVNDIFDFTAYLELVDGEPQLILPSYYDSETDRVEHIIKCSDSLKENLKQSALQSLEIDFIADTASVGNYTDLKASATIWTTDPLQSKVQVSICDNDEIMVDNLWIIFNTTSFDLGYYYRSKCCKPIQSTFLETLAIQATVAELASGYRQNNMNLF